LLLRWARLVFEFSCEPLQVLFEKAQFLERATKSRRRQPRRQFVGIFCERDQDIFAAGHQAGNIVLEENRR